MLSYCPITNHYPPPPGYIRSSLKAITLFESAKFNFWNATFAFLYTLPLRLTFTSYSSDQLSAIPFWMMN